MGKQDFIDLTEVVYRGAKAGKNFVVSPVPDAHLARFEIYYKGF